MFQEMDIQKLDEFMDLLKSYCDFKRKMEEHMENKSENPEPKSESKEEPENFDDIKDEFLGCDYCNMVEIRLLRCEYFEFWFSENAIDYKYYSPLKEAFEMLPVTSRDLKTSDEILHALLHAIMLQGGK